MDPYRVAVDQTIDMAATWPAEVLDAVGKELVALLIALHAYEGAPPAPPSPAAPPAPAPAKKP